MTSRETILAALDGLPHPRVPIDIGGTFATSFTAPFYDALRAELGLPLAPRNIVNSQMMLVETEAAVRSALGIDTCPLYFGSGFVHGWQDWTMPRGTRVRMPADQELRPRRECGWDLFVKGVHRATMPPGGFYFDDLVYAKWRDYSPSDLTDDVLRDLRQRAQHLHETTDLAVVLNTPYTIFNGTSPDFLCALIAEKDEVHERLETWTDHVLECLDLLIDAVGDHAVAMAFSGDAGTQRGPIVGPDLYREMLLPHFRRIPEFVHRHSNMKFFYHTCGSVYELIECFIALGVDVLNPLQVPAANMEADRLVRDFGGRLAFWGGGIDAQHTLVSGTEDEVRAKVRSQLAAYASQPRYVFAFDHNVQPDVPPRNLLAALEQVRAAK